MAKKGGQASISGNANLMNAAYRMSMANVPADLSGVHNRIAKSYIGMMQNIASARVATIGALSKLGSTIVEESAKAQKDSFRNWNNQPLTTGTDEKQEESLVGPEKQTDIPVGVSAPEVISDLHGNKEDITFNANGVSGYLKSIKKEIAEIKRQQRSGALSKSDADSQIAKLESQKQTLRASTTGYLTFQNTILETLKDAKNFNMEGTNGLNAMFLRALMNSGKPLEDGSYAQMGFTGNGEMVFLYMDKNGARIKNNYGRDITTKQNDISRLVTLNAEKSRAEITKGFYNLTKQGKDGFKWSDVSSDIDGIVDEAISNESEFKDISNWKGRVLDNTFANALHGGIDKLDSKLSADIYAQLTLLGEGKNNPFEADGKDGITASDFAAQNAGGNMATEKNYQNLISAILDTENPNFNLTLSKDLIKTWMVSNSEKYFTRGEDIYKKNNETPFDIEKQKELEQRQKNIQAAINSGNFNAVNTFKRSVEIIDGEYVLSESGQIRESVNINEKGATQRVMNWYMNSTEFLAEEGKGGPSSIRKFSSKMRGFFGVEEETGTNPIVDEYYKLIGKEE